MSDEEGDAEEPRHRIREQSLPRPFKKEMEKFVQSHEVPDDFRELRQKAKTGKNLSDVVKQERDERL